MKIRKQLEKIIVNEIKYQLDEIDLEDILSDKKNKGDHQAHGQ